MANRAESNSLRIAAYYSPPPQVVVYGPNPEVFEQDGYRPGSEDFSDQSFPLSDSYADERYEKYRTGVDQHPVRDEKPVQLVVTGPPPLIVSARGFRLRE